MQKQVIDKSISVIKKRIDESGTKEITLQQKGEDGILLQVPSITDFKHIDNLIGKTAKLTFHIANESGDLDLILDKIHNHHAPNTQVLITRNLRDKDTKIGTIIHKAPLLSGDILDDASVVFDNMNFPAVKLTFNFIGAKGFARVTKNNIGKQLAIVLDKQVISAPLIKDSIDGGSALITGNFSIDEANELAILLKSGSLPASLNISEKRFIEPSLGLDAIHSSIYSLIIGAILLATFMIIFYGLFGIIANLSLIICFAMIISVFYIMQITLTLPGAAGIILTLGMAVDANILIFERIKEEINLGKKKIQAIEIGYKSAFNTIFDANITTMIAILMLYIFASGFIRGFAISIGIGIICSTMTSVFFAKLLTDIFNKFLFNYNKNLLRD